MKTNRHSHSSNKGSLAITGIGGVVGLNHNFDVCIISFKSFPFLRIHY
jgi:hypothetical protein